MEERRFHFLPLLLSFMHSNGFLSILLDVLHKLSLFFEFLVLLNFTLQFCLHLLFQQRHLQLHPSLFDFLSSQLEILLLSLSKLQLVERSFR
jgi:hypothetical protein